MATRTSKQIVIEKHPTAKADFIYLPSIIGTRIKVHIIQNELLQTIGRGLTEAKAWQDASKNVQYNNI